MPASTEEVRQDRLFLSRPFESSVTPEFSAAHVDAPAFLPSGGDFHNVFPIHDGSGDVGVILGDVAGHGEEQTAQAEHMCGLLSDCLAIGMSPADTLTAVNAIVEPDPNFPVFGTVFAGTIEANTGKLTYASGGHEPALIAEPPTSAPQVVEELEGTGPPVGAFPADMTSYEQHEATITFGATLLVYSDGVSEVRTADKQRDWFGLDRLKTILAELAALPPRRLVSELMQRVTLFCRGRFHDDVSVLAVRREARRQK
ncbi:PP2C family protein-serine/threonine phosphatase [Capsulimonas corticalis]|nr:PP2C family protein-serine/threonine phosphatase [Capsulimonas corticalis]